MSREPRVASAPARVNLLGEQIDHSGGTVLPIAIQLRTQVSYTPGGEWRFVSEGHEEDVEWTRLVRGVLARLTAAGVEPDPGAIEVTSTVPEGCGLSSSAALAVALAGALSDVPPFELARLCRAAEHDAFDVPCGLMDPATAACAIGGHALALDCADETFFHLPLPDMGLFLYDSGVRRRLTETEYADRLAEAARDGTPAARHVAAEKARVERAMEALDGDDLAAFGALLFESHASLRDLYRCSHPELDRLVEALAELPGVCGARMIGAGWGGCVLAVTEPGVQLDGGVRVVSDDGLYRMA